MTNKKKESVPYSSLTGIHRAVPIVLFAFSVFTMFCFITQDIGALGHAISALFLGLFSYGAYAIPLLLTVHAVFYPSDIRKNRVVSRLIFSLIAITFISALAYSITYWSSGFSFSASEFYKNGQATVGGGFVGGTVGFCIASIVGRVGLVIIAASILAIYVSYFFSGGQRGLATLVYYFLHTVLFILSVIERAIKGTHRKMSDAKNQKVKRNTDLKNLELTDDEFFDVDNGMQRLSVSALGIKVTRNDADVNSNTTLHDKVFHKSAVSDADDFYDDDVDGIDDFDAGEAYYYNTVSDNDNSAFADPKRKNSIIIDYEEDVDYEVKSVKHESEQSGAKDTKKRDESADDIFTKSFDPFAMAMSEKLASKPSSKSVLDEQKGGAKIKEDVTELTPEEIEREKRILEFEKRKAAIVGSRRPTPVNNDGEFKGTPKSMEFHEHKDERLGATATETASASFVFDKSARQYEAPKAEPARYASIGINNDDNDSAFKTVVNKPQFSAPETIYSHSKTEAQPTASQSYANANTYKAPGSDNSYRAASYTDANTYKAPGSDNAYRPSYEEAKSYTAPANNGSYRAEASDDNDGASHFSIKKAPEDQRTSYSGAGGYNHVIYDKPDTKAESAPAASSYKADHSDGNGSGFYTSTKSFDTDSESDVKKDEYVPEFKPYNPTADAEINAKAVNIIHIDDEEDGEEDVSTIKIERERINDDIPEEIYSGLDDEDDEDGDADVSDQGDEDDGAFSEEEEIPAEKQNPVVHTYNNMFTALHKDIDEDDDTEKNYGTDGDDSYDAYSDDSGDNGSYSDDGDDDEDGDDAPPFAHTRVKPEPKVEKKKEEEKTEKKKPDFANYKKPPIDLLGLDPVVEDDTSEINENTKTLIDTLASFNVTASIKGVDRGPRITRYEVVPARGVKVNSITNLFNDIKLNLGKEGVRMEAPIPGKSAIGFEIPNAKPKTVRLRELIECEEFASPKASDTFVAIGKDVSGNPVFGDICKYPHALICGATGMGKSVSINSILISMLYRAHPKDVKLIMIDPKKVEFKMYSGIPHLLIPVITESKQAAGALMWAVEEMERRYELIETHCVRNIEAYNEKVAYNPSMGEPLPKIIIVIDELADLMMQVRDPAEDLIMRIAQKARAAGIHLIIGTQRPSTNIITGSIKANIPSRISCKVTSQVDSRTIFDIKGAEELLNKGDMLYWPVDRSSPLRVQGAFVSDKEVEDVMKFLKEQVTENVYDDEIFTEINKAAQKCGNKKSGGAAMDDSDGDDGEDCGGYYNDQQFLDAVELAIRAKKVSTSLLQRKLSIGYGKAAKYIDIMEDVGIVSEPKGQKPRDVLITLDEWHEKLSRVDFD